LLTFGEKGNWFPDATKFLQSQKNFRFLYQDYSADLVIGEKFLVFPAVSAPNGKMMLSNDIAKLCEGLFGYTVLGDEYRVHILIAA
jgi:hypothetical protein